MSGSNNKRRLQIYNSSLTVSKSTVVAILQTDWYIWNRCCVSWSLCTDVVDSGVRVRAKSADRPTSILDCLRYQFTIPYIAISWLDHVVCLYLVILDLSTFTATCTMCHCKSSFLLCMHSWLLTIQSYFSVLWRCNEIHSYFDKKNKCNLQIFSYLFQRKRKPFQIICSEWGCSSFC